MILYESTFGRPAAQHRKDRSLGLFGLSADRHCRLAVVIARCNIPEGRFRACTGAGRSCARLPDESAAELAGKKAHALHR